MSADVHVNRILVVDAYRGWRVGVGNALVASGYEVWTAGRGHEALLTLATLCDSQRPVDLLLTELEIKDMTGIELRHRVRSLCPDIQVMFMAYDDDSQIGADPLLRKPFSLVALERAVRRAIYPPGVLLRCKSGPLRGPATDFAEQGGAQRLANF